MIAATLPFLPAALLAILTLWSGTFQGSATFLGALTSQLAVLGFCLLGAPHWRDPLRLGHLTRWLVPAILITIAASWWISPVVRAGQTGCLLLPAYLLIPAAIATCWPNEGSRRKGLAAISVVVMIVSATAIAGIVLLGSARAAIPLGHHTLTAGWLVLLLPVVVAAGTQSDARRWLLWAAAGLGLIALGLTGSLLGGVSIACLVAIAAIWWKLPRRWLLVAVAALAVLFLPRIGRVVSGLDASTQARKVYLEAGLTGFTQRPLLGWGPGSTPWTIAEFTQPIKGLNPSTEIIGDLHSLPVQLAYELGSIGFALSTFLLVAFSAARFSDLKIRSSRCESLALLGLIGGSIFCLGSAPLAVPALPVALALVAGVSLRIDFPRRSLSRTSIKYLILLYVLPVLAVLLPASRAHFLYDQGRLHSDPHEALERLKAATNLDPAFPLYRARAAWLRAELYGPTRATAVEARAAADSAQGLAPLWLAAGFLGHQVGEDWSHSAFEKAHQLDPLSSLTAFHCLSSQPTSRNAADWGRQALSAEPSFAKAGIWRDHPELAAEVSQTSGVQVETWPIRPDSKLASLALVVDRDPALSFSLYAFRRSPWVSAIAPVELVMGPAD